ncbi:RNA polymerase factor sigma-54 [Parageobacillus sp. G301]|uniref:RNA polymerase factor sigma-54 n=1 Tax=Parageobacillus sp. G301 TaxID=2998290 RepID=UPI0024973227|nr:RNA polymerase factor sigma-54 [Parageobacillus sp. G301]GLH64357.1 RNA polymerase sigma-54 factor [Parageobacillus sp. G301]
MRAELLQEQRLKLSLTKELTQAIELLQYSAVELQSFLYEQSLENPFLEIRDYRLKRNFRNLSDKEKQQWIENMSTYSETLSSYLTAQLPALSLSEHEERIVHYMIACLDEDGYLRVNIEEIAERFAISKQEAEKALQIIQSLEPAGVGARNLQECLYLQLKRLPYRDEFAEQIIQHHFSLFVEKAWKTLAKQLGVDIASLQRVWDLIRTLEPRPGIHYTKERPHFIVPDIIVQRSEEGDWRIFYNEDVHPELIWNRVYEQKISSCQDGQVHAFVKDKYRQFLWLAKSLEQRKQTLLNIMHVIVDKQKQCFETGFAALKPLKMREVAEEIGIHESTVSRAVKNKYVQTPFGTVELRRFFSSAVSSVYMDEDAASSVKVKMFIKQLIEQENKQQPLSDQKIADLLHEQYGVVISRRTVAKYREQLHIPSSAKRKQYVGK